MNSPFGILKIGSYGQYVTYLQYALHILCFRVNGFDGIFGDGTYYAVMNYQNSRQLYADGVVGQATWNQITSEIYTIQSQLKNNGFYQGKIDGIAGINTYNAIINFQRANNLTPDGMVGNSTFNKLRNPIIIIIQIIKTIKMMMMMMNLMKIIMKEIQMMMNYQHSQVII